MTAPLNGAGIAGVCPSCTLQTFKVENEFSPGFVLFDYLPLATSMASRFGTTALNKSFTRISIADAVYGPALDVAANRDVVIVASIGNGAEEIFNLGTSLPHSRPFVIRVGATDYDDFLWRETTIVGRSPALRHPVASLVNVSCPNLSDLDVCVASRILDRCAGNGDRRECGSNIGEFAQSQIATLVAPGAQVVAGMKRGFGTSSVYSPVPPAVDNPLAVPPAETGLGVGTSGVAVRNAALTDHGPITGTSMAAPHVTATVGLMRSINPLLSAQAVRLGLTQRARTLGLPEPYEARRMGAGILNARHAVEDAAGMVRGARLRNRLVPMFSMYAASSQIQSESAEGEFFGATPVHAWLFTTNPQLASAAMKQDIYLSGWANSGPQAQFGPTVTAAYNHGYQLTFPGPLGFAIPSEVYELPPGAGKGAANRTPGASFYVYTTPHSPVPGYTLQPLYRLSTDMTVDSGNPLTCAGDQRKHLYSTNLVEVQQRTAATHVCNAAPMDMRYHFESIEGYVFDRAGPQPPGTFPLFRVFNTNLGFNVAALVVEGESLPVPPYSAPGLPDASNNPHFLGWVYRTFQPAQSGVGIEAADMDQDGLPNGVEIALGLNEQSANGDCDGLNDAVEYGFANLPADPMSPTATCTDGRLGAVYNAGLQTVTVTLSNPVGPVALPAGTKVVVYFTGVPQPPITLMGGGGSQCQSIATIGWDAAYECTLSSALPVGSTSAVAWQWTNVGGPVFQPGQNVAAITATPGLSDPVSGNNSRNF